MLSKIADHLGVTRGAVAQWTRIPADHVPAVSAVTGIPRHELRPDLWDAPDVAQSLPVPDAA